MVEMTTLDLELLSEIKKGGNYLNYIHTEDLFPEEDSLFSCKIDASLAKGLEPRDLRLKGIQQRKKKEKDEEEKEEIKHDTIQMANKIKDQIEYLSGELSRIDLLITWIEEGPGLLTGYGDRGRLTYSQREKERKYLASLFKAFL